MRMVLVGTRRKIGDAAELKAWLNELEPAWDLSLINVRLSDDLPDCEVLLEEETLTDGSKVQNMVIGASGW